jgi:hypothetical protein
MGGLREDSAGKHNIARPAEDLLSQKPPVFGHPDEVVGDQALTLAEKRSLLASWASDACAVEDSPSLRQLASGAVVHVDDIVAALKSFDFNQPRHEVSLSFVQSFARRGSQSTARRRHLRPDDDDEPPPSTAGAGIPSARKILTVCRLGESQLMGDSDWWTIPGWKPERGHDARSMASIPMNLRWKRVT